MAYPGGVRLAQVILSVFSSPHRHVSQHGILISPSTGDSLSVLSPHHHVGLYVMYGAWHIPEE